tara:strand:- start:4767 stop:5066 length:300 start_codon:yes stop_codon:yes gene_type:complete
MNGGCNSYYYFAHVAARVALAVARAPADALAKGRDHARAGDGLERAERFGHRQANRLVLLPLQAAITDGDHARPQLLAQVHLERGALDRGRRRRRAPRV